MAGGTDGGSRLAAAAQRRSTSERIRDWVDVCAKVIAAVVAIFVAFMANSFQSRISGVTLLSERERAESELRANMFKNLIEPTVGFEKGGQLPVERERLLVELLALNFHEHFELKPLFERVDNRFVAEGRKNGMPDEIRRERERLRSVARRIVDRQIAVLQKEEKGRFDEKRAKIYPFRIAERAQEGNEEQQSLIRQLEKDGKVYQLDALGGDAVGHPISDLTSPDGSHRLSLIVTKLGWGGREFEMNVVEQPSYRVIGRITPTWADLPFTDNTLLPDGNRFSVVIYSEAGPPTYALNSVLVKFIWFPKGFFTPRERPLEPQEVLRLVGKDVTWWERIFR